jgi:6-phosphogluconate dehydrogenase
VQAYDADPALPTLLADPSCRTALLERDAAWRQLVATAVLAGVPVPGMASALSYYDALRSVRLPAALVQGQRDFFGAHTYQRMDRPGVFHTQWSADQREHPSPPSTPLP